MIIELFPVRGYLPLIANHHSKQWYLKECANVTEVFSELHLNLSSTYKDFELNYGSLFMSIKSMEPDLRSERKYLRKIMIFI